MTATIHHHARRRLRSGIAVLLLGLTACSSPATIQTSSTDTAEDEHLLSVSITLYDDEDVIQIGTGPDAPCFGTGGYEDFTEGMNVVVHDGEGNVIGSGRLDDSTAIALRRCKLSGTVTIEDSDFYVVSVGHRGDQTYTADDLEAQDYEVELTLG